MINIEDLRVGQHICFDNQECIIEAIFRQGKSIKLSSENQLGLFDVWLNDSKLLLQPKIKLHAYLEKSYMKSFSTNQDQYFLRYIRHSNNIGLPDVPKDFIRVPELDIKVMNEN